MGIKTHLCLGLSLDEQELIKNLGGGKIDDNKYLEIADLTHEEFEAIDLLIKKGEATKVHKQQRKKGEFDNYILRGDKDLIDKNIRASMFATFVTNSSKIQDTKNNAFLERSFSENGEVNRYDIPSIYVNNTKEKLESLAQLTKLLGVDRSYDTATITRKNIEETGEYIKANIDQLTDKWGLDLRSHTKKGTDDNDINKGTLGFLNQILGKWGFQEIKRSENRKRKLDKKTNKRVDVGGYELRPKKICGF